MITRRLVPAVAVSLVTMPAGAGSTTITPLEGSLGAPFDDGPLHGWLWWGAQSASPMIGNLYDNIVTMNGGAATLGYFGPFGSPGAQAFMDWTNTVAQWGDDIHGLPAGAVITSLRYGYRNTVATTAHTIQIYDMIPPSAGHSPNANAQYGDQLVNLVLPAIPTGTAIVTVTGLSAHAGSAVWIKLAESGPGFPGTFWLSGGIGNGVGTTHYGVVYDHKDYYGPGQPLHGFEYVPYFYFDNTGVGIGPNIQISLSGIVPAPAAISLLGLGGLATLRRRRTP